MNYVVKYVYDWYELACECCTESSSEVVIYDADTNRIMTMFYVPYMYDESELREWMDENHPEYKGFVAHEESNYL